MFTSMTPIMSEVNGQEDTNKVFQLDNAEGKKIFLMKTEAVSDTPKANVLILPAYAQTVHTTFLYSKYLRDSNYNVYRFDGVNNAGLSSGKLKDYCLGQLEQDSKLVLDTILENESLPVIILALEESFVVAAKLAAQYKQIKTLASIMGKVGYEYDDISDALEKTEAEVIIIDAENSDCLDKDFAKYKEIVSKKGKIITIPNINRDIDTSLVHFMIIAQMLPSVIEGNTEIGEVSYSGMVQLMDSATAEIALINICEEIVREKR